MSTNQKRLLIEGWRSVPHSYSLVNQYHILELLSRGEIVLAHRDLPYIYPQWSPQPGLFSPEQEKSLAALRPPAAGERFDAAYRIASPYYLSASPSAGRTVVFGTAEFGMVPVCFMLGRQPLVEALRSNSTIVATPSNWSRQGFLHSGADPNRVVVVPHGADTSVFSPMDEAQRTQIRRDLGWNGFIFLTVGASTHNKGVDVLLKALAVVSRAHPEVRLMVKGLDDLYGSGRLFKETTAQLTPEEIAEVTPRVHYRGGVGSMSDIATLYQLADAYVAPYRAEGFGLPILEAAACGLPVICTAGGPTDDFVHDDFAQKISSEIVHLPCYGEPGVELEPNLDHLIELMRKVIEQPEIARRARAAGPDFVRANFTWRHAVDKLLAVLFPQT